jgi:hypothetical protein
MRQVNPWAQLATVFGMFIAGGFIGWGLSSWAAPGSGLAAGISGMLLPVAFAAGLLIWAGLDIVTAIVDRLRGRRHQPTSSVSPLVPSRGLCRYRSPVCARAACWWESSPAGRVP